MDAQPKITVYTKKNCGPCIATKRDLNRAGVPFEAADLTDALTEAFKERGHMAAPVVVIEAANGEVTEFAGYQPTRLRALPVPVAA